MINKDEPTDESLVLLGILKITQRKSNKQIINTQQVLEKA